MAIIWFSKLRDSVLWGAKDHFKQTNKMKQNQEGFILELPLVSLKEILVQTQQCFSWRKRVIIKFIKVKKQTNQSWNFCQKNLSFKIVFHLSSKETKYGKPLAYKPSGFGWPPQLGFAFLSQSQGSLALDCSRSSQAGEVLCFSCLTHLIFYFFFLGPHLSHMEVPRLGVESEL